MSFGIIASLISSQCFATVRLLDVGQPAPYHGYLFDDKQERQIHLDENELDYLRKFAASLQTINAAQLDNQKKYEDIINNYQVQVTTLSKEVAEKNDNFFIKTGYFMLGCIVTGLVSYGVYKSR